MKKQKELKVKVEFTEGWEERFAQAAYNLYLRVEGREKLDVQVEESA